MGYHFHFDGPGLTEAHSQPIAFHKNLHRITQRSMALNTKYRALGDAHIQKPATQTQRCIVMDSDNAGQVAHLQII